jgi:hypothetical protein
MKNKGEKMLFFLHTFCSAKKRICNFAKLDFNRHVQVLICVLFSAGRN